MDAVLVEYFWKSCKPGFRFAYLRYDVARQFYLWYEFVEFVSCGVVSCLGIDILTVCYRVTGRRGQIRAALFHFCEEVTQEHDHLIHVRRKDLT